MKRHIVIYNQTDSHTQHSRIYYLLRGGGWLTAEWYLDKKYCDCPGVCRCQDSPP